MISYLISDTTDSAVGLRLAGITGIVLRDKTSIEKEFDRCIKDKNIGSLILTEGVFEQIEDKVMLHKLNNRFPLIVEIPDRNGLRRDADYITDYINQSIGISI